MQISTLLLRRCKPPQITLIQPPLECNAIIRSALCQKKETALNHIEWTVYGLVAFRLHGGQDAESGFFSLQLLSKKVDGKHYLETDSIIALDEVTMNIMNS